MPTKTKKKCQICGRMRILSHGVCTRCADALICECCIAPLTEADREAS